MHATLEGSLDPAGSENRFVIPAPVLDVNRKCAMSAALWIVRIIGCHPEVSMAECS